MCVYLNPNADLNLLRNLILFVSQTEISLFQIVFLYAYFDKFEYRLI